MFESLDPETQVAIRTSVKHLKAARIQDICRVLLCGSSARGDYHADGDFDMAVVLGSTPPARRERTVLRRELSTISFHRFPYEHGNCYVRCRT